MATTVPTRVKKPRRTSAPRAAAPQPVNALATILAYLRQRKEQLDYEVLGRMEQIVCEQGEMRFPNKTGPVLARVIEMQGETRVEKNFFLLLSEWMPLPDLRTNTEEFCPDCLAQCDVCYGKTTVACTMTGCGGRGTIQKGTQVCPDCVEKTGHWSAECKTCGGRGQTPLWDECKNCQGTGTAPCAACRGLGKRPTGYQGGSRERDAKTCSTCRGTLRKGIAREQDWKNFLARSERFPDGRWDGYAILGPIRSFLLVSVGGMASSPEVIEVLPDAHGNRMVFLVKEPGEVGSEAYVLGGVLQVH